MCMKRIECDKYTYFAIRRGRRRCRSSQLVENLKQRQRKEKKKHKIKPSESIVDGFERETKKKCRI